MLYSPILDSSYSQNILLLHHTTLLPLHHPARKLILPPRIQIQHVLRIRLRNNLNLLFHLEGIIKRPCWFRLAVLDIPYFRVDPDLDSRVAFRTSFCVAIGDERRVGVGDCGG